DSQSSMPKVSSIKVLHWPFDRFMCDIASGWNRIKEMLDADPKMTQQEVFPTVFGIPYKRTTACKYKKQWEKSPENLCNKFIALGRSERGAYPVFDQARKAALGGPTDISGDVSGDEEVPAGVSADTSVLASPPNEGLGDNFDDDCHSDSDH